MQKLWPYCSVFAGFHLAFPCFWHSPEIHVNNWEMIQVQTGISCVWLLGLRLWPLWAREGKLCPTWEQTGRSNQAADGRMGRTLSSCVVNVGKKLQYWQLILNLPVWCWEALGMLGLDCSVLNVNSSVYSYTNISNVFHFFSRRKKIFHDKPLYFLNKHLS